LPADDPEGPWPQGQWLERHLQTHGQKDDEDSPWSFEREFYIRIPEGYDHNRPYPIVFQGPGCGGTHPVEGTYDFDGSRDQFVMVALRPQYGIHYETCFDDKEGEDSIDWPFFESLVDYMKARTCLDENRMFAAGNSSGAWLANELGCKYAGNTEGYNIRAVGPNTGGLPPVGQEAPICSGQPLAGIWIGDLRDPSNPWEGNVLAIERALRVNGCSNPDYHAAATELFEVPDQPDICRRVLGCPPDYPVVYCTFDNGTHEFHRDFGDVAFPRFFLSL